MEKKIKMLVIPDDYTGVSKFRSVGPHVYIQEHYRDEFDIDIMYLNEIVQNPDLLGFFRQYDIVQFHKQLDNECKIMDMLKFLDIPTVLDIDDHYKLGQFHPMHYAAEREKWHESIVSHLRKADYITTTTNIFANELRKFNKNIKVFPNAIDPNEPQFQQTKSKSDRIRFGLICGSTHLHDIELFTQGIKSLPQEILDKIQFVLCGFDTEGIQTTIEADGTTHTRQMTPEESVWCTYEKLITDNYKLVTPSHKEFLTKYTANTDDPFENEVYRRFWTRDITRYATHYENVDVLLAPLKECDFNKVKSQLKVIEAGFTDTAIIAQDYGPYQIDLVNLLGKNNKINDDGNALLVDCNKNHKQWAKYIKYLVENPEMINKLKENLKKTVTKTYSLEEVCKNRVEFYKNIVKKRQ